MLLLDLETLDTFSAYAHLPRPAQLAALRFGLATVYDIDHQRWEQFWSDAVLAWPFCGETPSALGMASIVQGPQTLEALWAYLLDAAPVVGWNIREFDIPYLMLQLAQRRIDRRDLWETRLPMIDLFAIIKEVSRTTTGVERWYKLDVVAQATLGRGKTADGATASAWLASNDPALVRRAAEYCRNDVALVHDLWHAAQTTGMICPPRPERGETGTLCITLTPTGSVRSVTHG